MSNKAHALAADLMVQGVKDPDELGRKLSAAKFAGGTTIHPCVIRECVNEAERNLARREANARKSTRRLEAHAKANELHRQQEEAQEKARTRARVMHDSFVTEMKDYVTHHIAQAVAMVLPAMGRTRRGQRGQ